MTLTRSSAARLHAFLLVFVKQTFFADPFVQEHVRLDAVVCLCDSPRLLRTLVSQPESAGRDATEVDDEGAATNIGDEKEGTRVASNGYHAETVDATASLVASQLALSDRVLLNKSDLITSDEVRILRIASLWAKLCLTPVIASTYLGWSRFTSVIPGIYLGWGSLLVSFPALHRVRLS